MLTLQFALDKDDSLAYFETIMVDAAQRQQKKSRKWTWMVMAIAMLVVVGADFLNGSIGDSTITFVIVFSVMLFLLNFKGKKKLSLIYQKSLKSQAKLFAENPDNQRFFEPCTYYLSETGIEVVSEYTNTKIQWPGFVKKQDTATHIFLFIGQANCVIFPKNKITALKELEQLLNRHISFQAELGREIPA